MTFKEYAAHAEKMYECTPVDGKHEKEYIIIAYFTPPDWMQKAYDNHFPTHKEKMMKNYISHVVEYPYTVIGLKAHRWGKHKGLPNWNGEIGARYFTNMAACSEYLENRIHSGHLYDYFNVRAVTFTDPETMEYVNDEGN